MSCVVINVYGGLVQDVFASDGEMAVYLVDWDTENCVADGPSRVEVSRNSGDRNVVHVARISAEPLSHLVGTDVERALWAAGIDPSRSLCGANQSPQPDEPGTPRSPKDLSHADLEEIVTAIQEFLFLEDDEPDRPWTLEKDCSGADFVELASWLLDKHGLAPADAPAS